LNLRFAIDDLRAIGAGGEPPRAIMGPWFTGGSRPPLQGRLRKKWAVFAKLLLNSELTVDHSRLECWFNFGYIYQIKLWQ